MKFWVAVYLILSTVMQWTFVAGSSVCLVFTHGFYGVVCIDPFYAALHCVLVSFWFQSVPLISLVHCLIFIPIRTRQVTCEWSGAILVINFKTPKFRSLLYIDSDVEDSEMRLHQAVSSFWTDDLQLYRRFGLCWQSRLLGMRINSTLLQLLYLSSSRLSQETWHLPLFSASLWTLMRI